MTNYRAIILLSQMYIPAFDDEEKEAITKAIEVLTEQEPVEPIYMRGTALCGKCGSRLHRIVEQMNYCPNCGRAVKWE